MNILSSELLARFKKNNILDELYGNNATASRIDPIDSCNKESLIFVSNQSYVDDAINAYPAIIITSPDLVAQFKSLTTTAVLSCQNVKLAHALVRQVYDDRDNREIEWPSIHQTATIHESATIAENVIIGPGVVIGGNVKVGRGSIIKANTVLEQDVRIGEDCILHPNVVVAYACELGNRVILKSGCVIGMEGFGFAQDSKGKSHRIPQTGKVIIGDDVLFGANCTVDRATYDITRIGAGCKFDALCHIGHNVEIDENCIMVTQSSIGGSTKVGKRVVISGQCVITDHVTICDDVVLVQRAGVINSIKKAGIFAGMPIQPMKDYFKNSAIAHKLTDLRKQVRMLEKQLAGLTNKE